MEITNEIKAKVFGMNIGQKIKLKDDEDVYQLLGVNLYQEVLIFISDDSDALDNWCDFDNATLILKPISAITDEDKKMLCGKYKISFNYFEETRDALPFDEAVLFYQDIISLGYDFKNALLGGKTLFESGLCTYETN